MGGDDRHAGVADERAELSEALPAYELGPVLGRGSFAVVFAARHRWLDRDVAVKRLSPALRLEEEARERFVAEARVLASLDHPHVIRVYDYVESERVCALVMERLRGGTLADRRQVAPPTPTQACAMTIAALHGLEHAHQSGILHRDIKPENILFGPQETVRVADFGIAKLIASEQALLTSTDSIIGTPAYMAPEQVDREIGALSAATDVWAAGVVLYELLAGETPYPRGEVAETLMQHVRDDPRHLHSLAPDVPAGVAAVVMRAVAREPQIRYGSALEFAEALEEAAGREAIAGTRVPIHRTPPRPDAGLHATIVGQPAPAGVAREEAPPPGVRSPLGAPGERERELLRGQPLFAGVPDALRDLIIDSFEMARFEIGVAILEEGVPTDGLYVIVEGTARVVRRKEDGGEVSLRVLEPGSSFGAPGLVHERPASATVRALEPLLTLKLDGAVFRALARMNPEVRALIDEQTRREQLNDFFRMSTPFGELPVQTIEELIARSQSIRVAPEEVVVTEGERSGPMYFVEDGHLRAVSRAADGSGEHDVGYLRAGDYFGEITAATGEPRRASVRAASECRLLRLDPADVRQLLDEHPTFRARVEARIAEYRYAPVGPTRAHFPEALPADARAQAPVPATLEVVRTEPPEDPRFGPRGAIGRFEVVWEVAPSDSGAACLAMVCRHFGRSVPLGHIRSLVDVGPEGTSLAGLAAGAERLGLATLTMRSNVGDLHRLGLPAVAHCGGNRWVTVYRVARERVHVADPAKGLVALTRLQFAELWTGHVAVFDPTGAFAQAPQRPRARRWAAGLVRAHRRALLVALGLALVTAALQAALPLLAQTLVDDALPDRDRGMVAIGGAALAAALGLAAALTVLQGRVLGRALAELDRSVFGDLADRVLGLPARYFSGRRVPLVEDGLAGTRQARDLLSRSVARAVSAGASLLVAVVVMFVVDVVLALAFLAAAPVYAGVMRLAARRLRPAHEARARSLAAYAATEADALRGIDAVKSAGAERRISDVLSGTLAASEVERGHAHSAVLTYAGLAQLTSFAMLALFLVLAALRVMDGPLTLGGLVAFSLLVLLAGTAVTALLALWDDYATGAVLLKQAEELLAEKPEEGPEDPGAPARELEGAIRVENLSFRFRGERSPEVLTSVSFTVDVGSKCAVVGRGGSGKTTLVKCLAGLLEPTGGRIAYDGVDARQWRRSDLRRQIGLVLQESHMFDDTIAANIALGDPDPDPERVRWAARIAKAHGFVDRLPQRYQTRIGESGLWLSSGQRQRLAIARAVYSRPAILIFDEAPNNLDPESGRLVQEAMGELLVGRTSFVVTHRIEEARDADLILVLDDGQLVEQGTHDELMAHNGLYHHLVEQRTEPSPGGS